MKKYFIKYFSNFCNVYDIVSVESDADKKRLAWRQEYEEWIQITLKEVKEKIREEKFRRKYDSSASGYAPIEVLSMSDYHQMRDSYLDDIDIQEKTTQLPEKKVKNKLVIQHKEKENVRTRGGLSK